MLMPTVSARLTTLKTRPRPSIPAITGLLNYGVGLGSGVPLPDLPIRGRDPAAGLAAGAYSYLELTGSDLDERRQGVGALVRRQRRLEPRAAVHALDDAV